MSEHRSNGKVKRQRRKPKKTMLDLPDDVIKMVVCYLDKDSLQALSLVNRRFHEMLTAPGLKLDKLPTEILTSITSYLSVKDLGRLSRVNKRFRDVVNADWTWQGEAKTALVTNGLCTSFLDHTAPYPIWSAKEKVRVSHNWTSGHCTEAHLAVQNIRYMPRIQLQRSALWVSWGKHIWSHPRRKDGTVGQTTNKVFKGHTDDVSKFVVKDGYLISGRTDR